MSGGLRELLGLPEFSQDSKAQTGEFGQTFRNGMAGLNQDMQVLAAHAGKGEQQKLDTDRQNLIAAYHSVNGDPVKNERLMAAVDTVKEKASTKATRVTAGRDEWQKLEESFDATRAKIGELEDADHPKATALRQAGDAIYSSAKGGQYQKAIVTFAEFRPKVDREHALYLQQAGDAGGGGGGASGGTGKLAVKSPAPLPQPTSMLDMAARQAEKLASQQAANLFSPAAREAAVRKVAENEAKKQKPKPTVPEEIWPALQFPPQESPVQEGDIRVSSDAPYDKLREDIKSKMSLEVWRQLGKQRSTLIQTYIRFKAYGIWDEVVRVTGIKEKLPPHGKIGPFEVAVHGTGGVAFEAHSADALIKKLIGTRHFGKDNVIMSLFHRGQTSLREWSNEQPTKPTASVDNSIHEWSEDEKTFTPTSLHISVGPGNKFDTHIDKVSPVNQPLEGHSIPSLARGPEHFSWEVIAPMLGGFAPYVAIAENKDAPHGMEFKATAELRLEWDFPSGSGKEEKQLVNNPKSNLEPPPEKVLAKILERVSRTKNYFPVPVGTIPDEVPEPEEVATDMAAKLLHAAQNRNNRVQMDVPFYFDKNGDHPAALEMMHEIGQIVRSELGPQAEAVTRLTVTFGSEKQGGTVSLAD